jgi:hypothetical protein
MVRLGMARRTSASGLGGGQPWQNGDQSTLHSQVPLACTACTWRTSAADVGGCLLYYYYYSYYGGIGGRCDEMKTALTTPVSVYLRLLPAC